MLYIRLSFGRNMFFGIDLSHTSISSVRVLGKGFISENYPLKQRFKRLEAILNVSKGFGSFEACPSVENMCLARVLRDYFCF